MIDVTQEIKGATSLPLIQSQIVTLEGLLTTPPPAPGTFE
jgi:hypothetical protein